MEIERFTHPAFGPARLTGWLLVLGLAALLTALGVRSAQAAASLMASENPVVIAAPQTSKAITLSWTLDAGQKATLTVKDNAQVTILGPVSLVAPPTSGTQSLTVECGKSYTATLVAQGTNQNLFPPLPITTQCRSIPVPASLTVSENPVKISTVQTSKTVTLSWTVDISQKATVTVKDNTQAVVLGPLAVNPPPTSGSAPLTVQCGKSYTATLVSQANNQNLFPPLAITVECTTIIGPVDPCLVTPCEPTPPLNPCLVVSCNKVTVTLDPHGMFANFKVTAEQKASYQLQVGKQAPVNGQLPVVEKAIFNLAKVTSWDTHIVDLDADTHYFYLAIATDEQGKQSITTGSFDTLKRVVTVSFDEIYIFDDSDDLGSGELGFGFWVNGTPITTWSHSDFGTGEKKNPGVTHTVKPAPGTLTIKVAGWDDDNTFGGPNFCNWQTQPSACGNDFAEGSSTYVVKLSDFGGPIPSQHFWVQAKGASLFFWATGSYTISYAK